MDGLEPIQLTAGQIALLAVEALWFLLGLGVWIARWQTWPARLAGTAPARLSEPRRGVFGLLVAALCAVAGGFVFQYASAELAGRWLRPAPAGEVGLYEVVLGASFQVGLLAGIGHAWFWHLREGPFAVPVQPRPEGAPGAVGAGRAVVLGFWTFCAVLPLVWLTAWLWHGVLEWFGIEPEEQDIVRLFARTSDPTALAVMTLFAVGVAPVAEELVFRVGFFRALRGRTMRAVALLLPAVIFAALHGSLSMLGPLVVLAVGFTLAYEESGHPLTPITAHALFNFNTLALLLSGLPM